MTESPIEAIQDAQGADSVTTEDAIAYLTHYGYIAGAIATAAINPVLAVFSFASALMEMQSMAGLPATGQLDDATRELMGRPRCGVLDVMRMVEFARWRKNRLTYQVQGYVQGLSQADQVDLIQQACQSWSAYADIQMSPITTGTPDIVIATGRGRAQGFDGGSGTLAWAHLPSGDERQLLMRFDMDESWTKDGAGVRFLNVAAHEIGHLLGLDHSRVPSALEAPYYSPGVSKPQANDDIPRIVALYGAATGTPTPTPTPADDQIEVAGRYRGQLFRGKLTPSAT